MSLASIALADSPTSEAAEIFGKYRGHDGITPPTVIVKVRYDLEPEPSATWSTSDHIVSGDALVWSSTSNDCYSVSKCVTSFDPLFAGIAVEAIKTADSSNLSGAGENVGYMAIKGWALANVAAKASVNKRIYPTAESTFDTGDRAVDATGVIVLSEDIGVLMGDPGTSKVLRPVFLE